jgi:hypothetical protein
MRARDRLKASFVITIAGSVAQSAGCGGVASDSGESPAGSGGGSETGGRTASGGRVSGGGGSGGTGGLPIASGGTNNPPPPITECVASNPGEPVKCSAAGKCTTTMTCRSGELPFTLNCDPARGYSVSAPCDHPYDYCYAPGLPQTGADCVDGSWRLRGVGGNPPRPCPNEPPATGQSCNPVVLGGDTEYCGYPCPGGDGWTVVTCERTAPEPADAGSPAAGGAAAYSWQPDGACVDGGVPPK